MRVLLLGGGGFLGRAVARALAARCIALAAPSSAHLDLSASGASGDLVNQLRPSDAVVMLAAITPDRDRSRAPLLANLRMAESVCRAVEKVRPSHLVYISSDAVYPFSSEAISERTPASPMDLYAAMHRSRELMFESVCSDRLAVLRPTAVYGSGDTHDAYGPNRFRRSARRKGIIHLFGGGEETRDHVFVDDVADLVIRVLRSRSRGLLNIASGCSLSFLEIAESIAARTRPAARIVRGERRQPATHRRFDASALAEAFPDFAFTPFDPFAVSRYAGETLDLQPEYGS